jgi:capsular polysaccharide export protein
MATDFIILDPRRDKRVIVSTLLAPLGRLQWRTVVPMRLWGYPETAVRAQTALAAATRIPKNPIWRRLKLTLLAWQYNGARAVFARNPQAVAVVWNGLNGSRRAFADGAKDAGARVLFFERAPLPGRVTVDPKGVNFANALPRDIGFYTGWLAQSGVPPDGWRDLRGQIRQRAPKETNKGIVVDSDLSGPFLFVPLQVEGDSQLRLFGGAYRTVPDFIHMLCEVSQTLPDGWHLRLKEHPSGEPCAAAIIAGFSGARPETKIVLDNATDTFVQVAASRGVITVNSSVGLEAMWYDKPVIACGQAFWALQGVATSAPDAAALAAQLGQPDQQRFDAGARDAVMSYLDQVYYPRYPVTDATLQKANTQMIAARLNPSATTS